MHHCSCFCGAVRFSVAAGLAAPNACHCGMCRKTSGHYFASAEVKKADLQLHSAEALRWYGS
jgi:hypothetical protein